MSTPVEYLKHPLVAALIAHGRQYRKCERTLLRHPKAEEFTAGLDTYVKDGDGVRLETSKALIAPNEVIARNPKPIGKNSDGNDMFNEWCISAETVAKNYGQEVLDALTETFPDEGFTKKATIQVIPLTKTIMDMLGQQGDVLPIKVSWNPKPQFAKIGDSLTSGGYSISAHDMADYAAIASPAMPLNDLTQIWHQLCDTPINDAGAILAPVAGFPAGIPHQDIQEWLERQNPEFQISALMNSDPAVHMDRPAANNL